MNKNNILIIVLVLVLAGFAFYWYSLRPEQIRKDCYRVVLGTSDLDLNYKDCLRRHGLSE